jgi:hypothetical protein
VLGGTFLDLSISHDGLPDDVESTIPRDKLTAISEFSKQLHIADTSKEGAYFRFETLGDKRLSVKLILDENGQPGKVLQSQSSDRASMLATMLVSPAACICEGHNVVGFLYSPDSLDATNKEKLNEYFCRVIGETYPNAGLVVFVRTRNVDEAMYLPPVNLVGALEFDGFIPIMPASDTMNNIRQCCGSIKKENPVIFFLGAGCASEANIPMGPDLCRKALEQLLCRSPEDSYDEIEQQFWEHVATRNRWLPGEREIRDKGGRPPLTFERVIREQISQHGHAEAPIIEYLSKITEKSTPSSGHLAVAQTIQSGYKILIVTTNYDSLIEQALGSYGLKSFAVYDEETAGKSLELIKSYLRGKSDIVPIVKLHGTIDLPPTISASVEDTTSLKPMIRGVFSMIVEGPMHKSIEIQERIPVVFFGYAFRDVDIQKVLYEKDTLDGMDCWVVDPLPRSPIYRFLSKDSRHEIITAQRVLSTRFGLCMGSKTSDSRKGIRCLRLFHRSFRLRNLIN